jgi:pyridoxamine 5'-phosphate oxidase
MNLADLRRSYTRDGLDERNASTDPFEQFARWFEQVRNSGNPEPNAMALATASASGIPSVRIVLLKGASLAGFTFYTNYDSRKAVDLEANPNAALMFYWPELERQVRISGTVHRVSREESEAYFHSRPRGHQIGAWASDQSSVIASREALGQNVPHFDEDKPVPLPPFWGGYRVVPSAFEFRQGRPNRLHDRLEYVREVDGSWLRRRLAP